MLLVFLLAVCGSVHSLSEYGIEGMHVVSTKADESKASISKDGKVIVWSRRASEQDNWDVWYAILQEKRWSEPTRLPFNTSFNETDPVFSPDMHWLYFSSDRSGGQGGFDIYRIEIARTDPLVFGRIDALTHINTAHHERSPSLNSNNGQMLFSRSRDGMQQYDIFKAALGAEGSIIAMDAINTAQDELDPVWLDGRAAILFTRHHDAEHRQMMITECHDGGYLEAKPVAVSFNSVQRYAQVAGQDLSRPNEILVSTKNIAPTAGGYDVYRIRKPAVHTKAQCN